MSDWDGVGRVLAIRLDAMGDVLMTTPALRAIRENVGHLTLLTSPSGAAISAMIPYIDDIIVYAAPWMKAGGAGAATEDMRMIAALRAQAFDAAIIFTVFSQTPFPAAMLARLAGIPRVLMYARERAYALGSDVLPETEPESGIRHEVQRHLDLVATRGWVSPDTRLALTVPESVRSAVTARGLPTGRWCVVHPGSTAPSRRWPADYFCAVVTRLTQTHGWRVIVTGDASERDLCAQVAGTGAENWAGTVSLEELVALVDAAPVLITNNTGPAHIAAAVGTAVVDLYALTNPQHTPWQVPARVLSHDVDCRWCFASICRTGHHRCLRDVRPETVVQAALDLAQGAVSNAA